MVDFGDVELLYNSHPLSTQPPACTTVVFWRRTQLHVRLRRLLHAEPVTQQRFSMEFLPARSMFVVFCLMIGIELNA
jgi:hypothetical protein